MEGSRALIHQSGVPRALYNKPTGCGPFYIDWVSHGSVTVNSTTVQDVGKTFSIQVQGVESMHVGNIVNKCCMNLEGL